MEISPYELYESIRYEEEVDKKEMTEIIDSYLPTTIELLCESIYERLKFAKDDYSIRLAKSIKHQLEMISHTNLVSNSTREHLDKINEILGITQPTMLNKK